MYTNHKFQFDLPQVITQSDTCAKQNLHVNGVSGTYEKLKVGRLN